MSRCHRPETSRVPETPELATRTAYVVRLLRVPHTDEDFVVPLCR
jgi:hypothetical protein